jgi:hypothetical protein
MSWQTILPNLNTFSFSVICFHRNGDRKMSPTDEDHYDVPPSWILEQRGTKKIKIYLYQFIDGKIIAQYNNKQRNALQYIYILTDYVTIYILTDYVTIYIS